MNVWTSLNFVPVVDSEIFDWIVLKLNLHVVLKESHEITKVICIPQLGTKGIKLSWAINQKPWC